MTQLELAKNNKISPLVKRIAALEHVDASTLRKNIAQGKAVVLNNAHRALKKPCGVGLGLRTKTNANIGTSTRSANIKDEIIKLKSALDAGADAVMDLSVGGDLQKIRREVLKRCYIPLGTVPIYEAAVNAQSRRDSFLHITKDDLIRVLEEQAQDGVDFFTIHAGITLRGLSLAKKSGRLLDIVSRGGAILAAWMNHNKKENPFYEYFDEILAIARAYDITLSLGDALRPGSIFDATDAMQLVELKTLGELALRCRAHGVQVIIEGPGHVPLQDVKKNIELEKKLCHGAPFYVLGPLVTDVASGYDHISSAIGGAIAGASGADFLCYVTPSEHLRQPDAADVWEGVMAARIAAHSADIAKGIASALAWDKQMSLARRKRDWHKQIALSVDPLKARRLHGSIEKKPGDACTMCGDYCSIKLMQECIKPC